MDYLLVVAAVAIIEPPAIANRRRQI